MKGIPHVAFIGGAVVLGIIALALLIGFRPKLSASPEVTPSGVDLQTDGVIKGTDSYNLPGTTAYPNVTPPVYRNRPQPTPAPTPEPGIACTMEAMQCPDGSYVGRVAPNCQFAACPGN